MTATPAGTTPAGTTSAGRLLAAIADVGRAPSGGYERFAWTTHDLALREWFAAEADARGLTVVTDRAGNQWAWWGDPDADGPGVVTGSHLDSVPGGGAFDGPLGVASAFAALDALRAAGVRPARPLGIVNFSDEEGARFGLACLGSRAVTGTVPADRLLALRDGAGDSLADVLDRVGRAGSGDPTAGFGPAHYGRDEEALARVGVFVELHVEQGRYLADLPPGEEAPVAVGAAIWPHGRWRVDLVGEANHAGTTPLAHRHDPMLDLSRLVTDVRSAAEHAGALATLAKVQVEPNGVNAIPSRVRAWIDARADQESTVRSVLTHLSSSSAPDGSGAGWELVQESWTPATVFDPVLAARLADVVGRPGSDLPAPVIGTGAGHDAGILAAAGVPTAMLFVRNPTGISHSPAELAEEADCDAGVRALTAVLADLLTVGESR
ncbi:allantoate amidohydrolase [Promicromonospora iranensis]|uniref:N-carbamoyl-L-amino-acid hydrolase n=1 Tax=Promicromonospora iranensis TaxID=1105144 RepID=A0ABU2CT58_9MICO|nr:allantoate amidohydrolase [Promicromonospora iranensis]MDR7384534.1 N-carbamoyl-L-amino-acid hydrolase [Promicromonospora iranensis]